MRPLVLASALLLMLSGCATLDTSVTSSEVAAVQTQSAEPTENESEQPESSSASESPEQLESAAEPESTARPETTVESEAEDAPERVEEVEVEASPSPTATATPTPTQTSAPEPEVAGYTLTEISLRNTSAECWVAIDGGVYDLTMWIRSHPGGSGAITQLCGTDGTAQFLGMHGGQSRPASALDTYYIGPLR